MKEAYKARRALKHALQAHGVTKLTQTTIPDAPFRDPQWVLRKSRSTCLDDRKHTPGLGNRTRRYRGPKMKINVLVIGKFYRG